MKKSVISFSCDGCDQAKGTADPGGLPVGSVKLSMDGVSQSHFGNMSHRRAMRLDGVEFHLCPDCMNKFLDLVRAAAA